VVDSTKYSFTTILLRWTNTEREQGLVEKTLVDHVIERWDNTVDRDRVICKTQDAVELAESKGKTRLLGGFSKILVANSEVTYGELVLRDIALHRTRAILDGELGTIGLVCRGTAGLVLGMQETCDGVALRARDP